ncbi:MAG: GDP-mannose 4,6-dehydratase [Clostridiales bacterium]|jgi:NAD dependent epimerase/dehydratase|nr:GDP-mannose 4,6-dehydratase [Clostridiales bacterium]
MAVLVTGADGFIGSHLVEALHGKCGSVTALCCYNSFNDWGNLEGLPASKAEDVRVVTGDVRDPFLCASITQGIDVIFNLAALIAIPYSYVAPQSYIETNVTGALNICQAALRNGASRVVQISTSEVYGTAEYVPIDERHPLKPQSPYSASKIGADSIALSFWHSFELPVTIARPFNTYGPRQSARAFIPTIITQIASGKRRIRLGDLTPTRDLNFVKDTCAALIRIAECGGAPGEAVNIGTGIETSVGDVFTKICEIMRADVEIERDEQRIRPRGSEVFRLLCDNAKLRGLTGFVPAYSLDAGLAETVEWFTDPANRKRYKSDIYNV